MRVIVDTNVFVSGLLWKKGPPARVVDAVLAERITAVFSQATLDELEDVLSRPKLEPYFIRAKTDSKTLVNRLRRVAEIVEPGPVTAEIRDKKDRPFLELAGADPPPDLLVTGDKDFSERRYGAIVVVTAAQLAALLD